MLRSRVIHESYLDLCHCHVESGSTLCFGANLGREARRLLNDDWSMHRIPSRSPCDRPPAQEV
jgi:hypothetical protein